jgi:histidinol phosphatase-like PHP family hydrolase
VCAALFNFAPFNRWKPERLDLYAPLLRSAKRKGVRLTISTDLHQIRHLQNMQYGTTIAGIPV